MGIINLCVLAERAYLSYSAMRHTVDGGAGEPDIVKWKNLPKEEKALWKIVVDVILRVYDEMKKDSDCP
jgi:hypothetical protein